MIRINIHEAKTHLSRVLDRLKKGDVVLICKRNVPVAELRPIVQPEVRRRRVGFMKGEFSLPPSFFDPLGPELLEAFEGSPSRKRKP